MDQEIKIKTCVNGWILSWQEQWDDETWHEKQELFAYDLEAREFKKEELESARILLYTVLERLDIRWSKHDPFGLEIEVKKQIL